MLALFKCTKNSTSFAVTFGVFICQDSRNWWNSYLQLFPAKWILIKRMKFYSSVKFFIVRTQEKINLFSFYFAVFHFFWNYIFHATFFTIEPNCRHRNFIYFDFTFTQVQPNVSRDRFWFGGFGLVGNFEGPSTPSKNKKQKSAGQFFKSDSNQEQ